MANAAISGTSSSDAGARRLTLTSAKNTLLQFAAGDVTSVPHVRTALARLQETSGGGAVSKGAYNAAMVEVETINGDFDGVAAAITADTTFLALADAIEDGLDFVA